MKKPLQHLDVLLGEALECLNEAAREVRSQEAIPENESVRRIGSAICSIWEIREQLYKAVPTLKRDFVQEWETDKIRAEQLSAMMNQASTSERAGNLSEAESRYTELLTSSRFGFYRLVAEAGLYRIAKARRKAEPSEGSSNQAL